MFTILCIGKIKFKPYRMACDEYLKRIQHYAKITEMELKHCAAKVSDMECRRIDTQTLFKSLDPTATLCVLDERGKTFDSLGFAKRLEDNVQFGKPMQFAIGGSNGHTEDLRKKADHLIAFSPLTFPHELARVILYEQLYRALTIINNHPYHK